MTLQSRFTSSEAVAFEFGAADTLVNRSTLFESHVGINFATASTTAGNVQIFISNNGGEI